jgi:S1-C subfamily serine protease
VVNRVVPRLIADGRYVRPGLGVRTEARLNDALSARLGVRGVLVLDVEPGSPAAAAGIRPARIAPGGAFVPGDVIVAVAGRPVSRVPDLLAALDRHPVGAVVRLTLEREGRRLDVEVTLQPAG